jgi:hypothetical protein
MPDFYAGFTEQVDLQELTAGSTAPSPQPQDFGGDTLPFSKLSGRRFEILVYRLKAARLDNSNQPITLMQGVGERGRDILIYSADGALMEIVQCKNYESRLDRGELIRELGKLALHHYQQPGILGNRQITYEMWCPPGLSEPANELLDMWPSQWTENIIRSYVEAVIETFAAFKGLTWPVVRHSILTVFPQQVRPRKVDGILTTVLVRQFADIYRDFFQGAVVMNQQDVEASLRRLLGEAGLPQLTDEDVAHLIKRIQSFPNDRRIYMGFAHVFGLSAEFIASMQDAELREFAQQLLAPVKVAPGLVPILITQPLGLVSAGERA